MSGARRLLIVCAIFFMLAPATANAGCFLFFCSHPRHAHHRHKPHRRIVVVVHRTIRKTVVVYARPGALASQGQKIKPIE